MRRSRVFSFALAVDGTEPQGRLAAFGVACVVGTAAGIALLRMTRREPWRDPRPTPRLVLVSFAVFVVVLLIVSTLLLTGRSPLPWPVTDEQSTVIGLMFLGAAAYFVYGLARPFWENAGGQLAGFLAYDVVLIWPFLKRLPDVTPEFRLELWVYTAVVVYSAIVAIVYLAFHPVDPRASPRRARSRPCPRGLTTVRRPKRAVLVAMASRRAGRSCSWGGAARRAAAAARAALPLLGVERREELVLEPARRERAAGRAPCLPAGVRLTSGAAGRRDRAAARRVPPPRARRAGRRAGCGRSRARRRSSPCVSRVPSSRRREHRVVLAVEPGRLEGLERALLGGHAEPLEEEGARRRQLLGEALAGAAVLRLVRDQKEV